MKNKIFYNYIYIYIYYCFIILLSALFFANIIFTMLSLLYRGRLSIYVFSSDVVNGSSSIIHGTASVDCYVAVEGEIN